MKIRIRGLWRFLNENKWLLLALALLIFMGENIRRMNFPVTDFSDTVLSMASSKNADMGKLVKAYYLYVIPLCFFFAYTLLHSKIWNQNMPVLREKMQRVAIKGNGEVLFWGSLLLTHLILGNRNWISIAISIFIILVLFLSWRNKALLHLDDHLIICLSLILAFSIPVFYLGLYIKEKVVFSAFLLVLLAGYGYVLHGEFNYRQEFYQAVTIFMGAAVCDVILLYFLEILLIRGYKASDVWLLIPYIIAIFCFIIKPVANLEIVSIEEDNAFRFPFLLLLGMMSIPVLGRTWSIDFFEGANHGLSVQEAVEGWGVPLFQNLDAHLLSNTLGGLLYYLVTGDYQGALFAPYAPLLVNILGVFSIYAILHRFFAQKKVFAMMLLFPWGMFQIIFPGLIGVAAFWWWEKRNNWLADMGVCVLFVGMCFYRIDVGASFGLALILVSLIYNLSLHKFSRLLQYFIAGFAVAGMTIFLCCKIAGLVNIELWQTAASFFTAFLSNQHWGYADLGKTRDIYWFYFVLPAVITVLMIPYFRKLQTRCLTSNEWGIILFYTAYLLNWPRALVRHTMAEHSAATYALPVMLFAFLVVQLCKKHRACVFLIIMLIATAIGVPHKNSSFAADLDNLAGSLDPIHRQESVYHYQDENDARQIRELKQFFDEMLLPDETYIDFTNQSLFFAYTGRKNPIYINQCPGMINGKRGQLQTLESIQEKTVCVLMPYKGRVKGGYGASVELDGILNSDRYYLLTEYIAENYRPYCSVGDFAVWTRKDLYDSMRIKDAERGTQRNYLGYVYDSEKWHAHKMGFIPYLWGQYASNEDQKGDRFSLQKEKNFWRIADHCAGKRGFLVLTINAQKAGKAHVKLTGSCDYQMTYDFNVQEGRQVYRLRVSSDIWWYTGRLNCVQFVMDNAEVENIVFQEIGNETVHI